MGSLTRLGLERLVLVSRKWNDFSLAAGVGRTLTTSLTVSWLMEAGPPLRSVDDCVVTFDETGLRECTDCCMFVRGHGNDADGHVSRKLTMSESKSWTELQTVSLAFFRR